MLKKIIEKLSISTQLKQNLFKMTFAKGPSINHVTVGGEGFWQKRHETVTREVGVKDFLKPTKCDFDIFPFFLFMFYQSVYAIVALVQDFQNRICFIAQGTYP